jgi:outer membrane protein TolC
VAESRSGAGGSATPRPVEPDAAAPSAPLSIEGAVLRALDRSGDVAALRAAVALAEQRRRAAGDLVDPELQFGLSGGSGDGDRLRESTRRTEASSAGKQGSRGTLATTETTTGLGGIPDSTASSFRETAEQAALTSAGTRTESSRASGWTSEEDDGYRIGVRLFVPNLWQWSPRMAARRAEIEAARADLQAAEWNVASEVRRLCAELDFQTNDLALAEARLRLDEEIVKLVKARADRGAATCRCGTTCIRRGSACV